MNLYLKFAVYDFFTLVKKSEEKGKKNMKFENKI